MTEWEENEEIAGRSAFYFTHLYGTFRSLMTKEQRADLVDALFDYSVSDCQTVYDGGDPSVATAFAVMASKIKTDAKKYKAKCETNRKNASKKNKKASATDGKQSHATATDGKQSHATAANRIEKNRREENRKEKILDKEICQGQQGDHSPGMIVTPEELQSAMEELEDMGFTYDGRGKGGCEGWILHLVKEGVSLDRVLEACADAVAHDASDHVSYVMQSLRYSADIA